MGSEELDEIKLLLFLTNMHQVVNKEKIAI